LKRLLLILLLLFGCATAQVTPPTAYDACYPAGEVLFIVNVGFEVEYDLNKDTRAIAWLTSIELVEEDCKREKTNLITFWDGGMYRLYEVQKINDGKMSQFLYIGQFENFTIMADFIKITRGAFTNEGDNDREM
jgi:hypothetical protein